MPQILSHMVAKIGGNLDQSRVNPLKKRTYRLGYAAQGTDYQFSKEVSESLQRGRKGRN